MPETHFVNVEAESYIHVAKHTEAWQYGTVKHNTS